jgi:hypothetical protein
MKVIKPFTYDPSMVVSNNAPEAHSLWVSGTSYAKNAEVLYAISVNGYLVNHVWKSLVSTNTTEPSTDDTKWQDMGVCNKCAAFDGQISTETTKSTSPLTIVIRPGLVNSLAVLGITGQTLTVSMTDDGESPTVYSRTIDLEGSIILDWYMYFFEPFEQLAEVVLTDLPPYANGEVTINLASGGAVAIGEIVFGTVYGLGENALEHGATIGIIDYSRKDTDPDTGLTTFVQRAYSKRMSGQFLIENGSISGVQKVLSSIRAIPSVFIGSEDTDYSALIVYGFYRDFSIDIAYPTHSFCRIEVEGLI